MYTCINVMIIVSRGHARICGENSKFLNLHTTDIELRLPSPPHPPLEKQIYLSDPPPMKNVYESVHITLNFKL